MSFEEISAMNVGDRISFGIVICVLDDSDGRAVVNVLADDAHKTILQRVAGTTEIVIHHI